MRSGRFFVRCLQGGYWGQSGRTRLDLPSRLYLAVANFKGDPITPRVFHTLKDLRSDIFVQAQPGSAVFCGFATHWEARIALEEAGLTVPASLVQQHVRSQPGRGR